MTSAPKPQRRAYAPTTRAGNDQRAKLMKAIHAACRGATPPIGQEDRRAIQRDLTGKDSLAEMTIAEMARVLDHLNRGSGRTRQFANRPHIAKIKALWWSLYWLGEVRSSDITAIDKFVRSQTGLSALRFVDVPRGIRLIEALKLWLDRIGVPLPDEELGDGLSQREAIAVAIWRRLADHPGRAATPVPVETLDDAVCHYAPDAVQAGSRTVLFWDMTIRALGAELRAAIARTESTAA